MGNLVNQVKATYEAQIETKKSEIQAITVAKTANDADIAGLVATIGARKLTVADLNTNISNQQQELARLQGVRNQKGSNVPGGCKRTVGYDNACLDANTNRQNACISSINSSNTQLNAVNVDIATKNGLLETAVIEQKRLAAIFIERGKELNLLNQEYADKTQAAQIQENSVAVTNATAANSSITASQQSEIERIRANAAADAERIRVQAATDADKIKVNAASETEKLKSESGFKMAMIGAVVFIVLVIGIAIVVIRK